MPRKRRYFNGFQGNGDYSDWNRSSQAAQRYRRVLSLAGAIWHEQVMPGITGEIGQARLGIMLLQIPDPKAALDAFDRSLSLGEGTLLEAVLGRAEALLALGERDEALSILESARSLPYPDIAVLLALAGEGEMPTPPA